MRAVILLLALVLPFLEAHLLIDRRAESPSPPRVHLAADRVLVPFLPGVERPLVPVRVDGFGPFPFLLDTGAAGHGRIDERWVRRLGLEVIDHAVATDVTGVRTRVPVVRAGVIGLAGARFEEVRLLAMDLRRLGVVGILGFGLFDGLPLTIDGPARALELGRLDASPPEGVGRLDVRGGLPWVELAVGGRRAQALLDSGAAVGLLLPPRWRRDLDGRTLGRMTLSTTGAELAAERVRLAEEVRIQGVRVPSVGAAWVERFERPLVGWDVMCRLRLTFSGDRAAIRVDVEAGE